MQDDNVTRVTISDGGALRAVLEVVDERTVVAVYDRDGILVPASRIPNWVWQHIRQRGLIYARDVTERTRSERTRGPHEKFCSACGATILMEAEICPHCGVRQHGTQRKQTDSTPVILEALFGFIGIMGIGWMNTGRVGQGVALLLGGFMLVVLIFISAFSLVGLPAACLLVLLYYAIWIVSVMNVNRHVNQSS